MKENDPGTAAAAVPTLPPPPPSQAETTGLAQYEFSVSENSVISRLGSKMSFVGLFMLGIGLVSSVLGVVRWVQSRYPDPPLLFLALLLILVGIWTHRAGREFLSVAETEGNDVSHLMVALSNLLKFYTLLYLLFFVALVFVIIQLGAHSVYGTHRNTPAIIERVQSQGSTETALPLSRS